MNPKAQKTIQATVKVSEDTYESLKNLAAKNHSTIAAEMRKFIDKGMSIESYQENIDFLTQIIRQEIKTELTPAIERIIKMQMRQGKLSAAVYYSTVKTMLTMLPPNTNVPSFKEMLAAARKWGIKYMITKEADIDKYLEDDDLILGDVK